ncbi:hypothetical protein DE146DRAFT_39978 [Phaeosphaeria sp. MPI-PUGE-AT-0046c]|nr:hypothetical protein DE146DRAFT_39978 [Phaeosphaeria sp. MPI-PUGE-AT-0046c]
MKFLPTSLLTLATFPLHAAAKPDTKPRQGTCNAKQEYDTGCSDILAPQLGANTIVVCNDLRWHVLVACADGLNCTEKSEPHCWSGSFVVGDEEEEVVGGVGEGEGEGV